MTENERRMKIALGVVAKNLEGEGFEAFKPISPKFANELASFAWSAFHGTPDERLDALVDGDAFGLREAGSDGT